MSWYTSELRVRLAPLNRFKPSSKIFYWLFQGGTSFVDLSCFCSVLWLLCLCASLFICALWSPAGKGLTSWLSFLVSTVSLLLSHLYPGSGVLLDWIDSWSLHPYLLNPFYLFFRKFWPSVAFFLSLYALWISALDFGIVLKRKIHIVNYVTLFVNYVTIFTCDLLKMIQIHNWL